MLKEALQYIVGLKENKTYEIGGNTYSDNSLVRIEPEIYRPRSLTVNGLESVVKLIRHELLKTYPGTCFIRVCSHRGVEVFGSLDERMQRDCYYKAECDAPEFRDTWMSQDEAIIALRSMFIENEDVLYLLDLLSRISREDGITSDDNGVSQSVTARQGIRLKQFEEVKPRVKLAPYRTFSEIEQPESGFLLRLNDDAQIRLIEADGGIWKLAAKNNIKTFFEETLSEYVESGRVVIMR